MTSHSYSSLNCFKTCKHSYLLKYIQKVKTPFLDNNIFEFGRIIHQFLEKYPEPISIKKIKYTENTPEKIDTLIQNILKNDEIMEYLKPEKIIKREHGFFFDKDFNVLTKKTNSIFNGKIDYIGRDCNNQVSIIDWKSGKSFSGNFEQLMSYAIWLFRASPYLEKIKLGFFYVEQGIEKTEFIERSEIMEHEKSLINLINEIENTTSFAKMVSKKCDWCAFLKICKPFNI